MAGGTFKTGDLVQLKSGGPVMTVDTVSGQVVYAAWFAGAKHERTNFQAGALQIAVLKDEKKK